MMIVFRATEAHLMMRRRRRFCRATRAVSMAPAAYYAHLLAARARAFLDDSDFSSDSDSRGYYTDTVRDIGPNSFHFPALLDCAHRA